MRCGAGRIFAAGCPGVRQQLTRALISGYACNVVAVAVHLVVEVDRDARLGAGAGLERAAVRQAASRLAGGSTQLLVNDRLDLALAVGGVGVHLRSHSVKGADARRWLPAALPLGRSVHSLAEARAAVEGGGLNYLVWGTVFPTVSKPGAPTSGPSPIREASRTVSLPILAIGGITVDNSREVFCEGAAGVAAIGLFGEVREPARLRSVVGEIRQRYLQSHGPD